MIRVNGELMEWKEGMTIQDILDLKGYTYMTDRVYGPPSF